MGERGRRGEEGGRRGNAYSRINESTIISAMAGITIATTMVSLRMLGNGAHMGGGGGALESSFVFRLSFSLTQFGSDWIGLSWGDLRSRLAASTA